MEGSRSIEIITVPDPGGPQLPDPTTPITVSHYRISKNKIQK
jgi:hypothetical protein